MAKGKIRDKGKEAFWQRTIQEQRQSGLSVRAFCRKHAAHESAFYFWRRELARREEAEPGATTGRAARSRRQAAFVPVHVAEDAPAGGRIEIVLPGGRRIHAAPPVDRQALADVLAVLECADHRPAVHTLETTAC